MNRAKLKKFLLKNGLTFEGIENADGRNGKNVPFGLYESKHITVYVFCKIRRVSVSFGHSASGYYSIDNATESQVMGIVKVLSASKYIETSNIDLSNKDQFALSLLRSLMKSIESKCKK